MRQLLRPNRRLLRVAVAWLVLQWLLALSRKQLIDNKCDTDISTQVFLFDQLGQSWITANFSGTQFNSWRPGPDIVAVVNDVVMSGIAGQLRAITTDACVRKDGLRLTGSQVNFLTFFEELLLRDKDYKVERTLQLSVRCVKRSDAFLAVL